ncbi:response regulator [Acetivibrio clariflavus]|uniref:Stage 0 sporulation protein A homolog n=1 Tax=Acetivibrio clariflavus (strain DSM 19732 / NBRC 101661 / EBR45) TaxID=720554 RepID=G8M308_ACECE|nr:response regulator [Acetivibrio clariflavus]AEV69317.1 response regulator containing CheY-like receiver domain and AraC-type DNA-binding domain [Acetivibrio clariflavus DSM 19732]
MRRLTFCVVDDAVFMRTLLKKMIEEVEGYKVVGEGSNGYDAIDLAKIYKPDVMTLDITMPDLDGIKAIEDVLKVSPQTKIIMVSAMGQQSMVIEAIKLGAKDFVVKPFEKDRVLQAIKNVTGN